MDSYINKLYKKHNCIGVEDAGAYRSEEFNALAKSMRTAFRNSAKARGFELESFNIGHYYVSGFFKKEDKFVYFSWDCPRGGYAIDFNKYDPCSGFLYRTASGPRDYHGGTNHFCGLPEFMDAVEKLF